MSFTSRNTDDCNIYAQFHIATHSKHRHDLLDEREKREGQKKKSVNLSRIIISTIDYSPAFKNIN
jgi:hypothetical protein